MRFPGNALCVRFEYDYFEHPKVNAVFRKLADDLVTMHTRDSHSVTLVWFEDGIGRDEYSRSLKKLVEGEQ